jgi:phytoene dehydrogenase-like protein
MAGSVIIIGAGIAGLATGVYARLNGYDAEIFELHDKPGGVCTGWQRRGFTFEGCLHALAGTGKNSALRKIWRDLGVDFDSWPVIHHQELVRIEDESGKTMIMHTDPADLEAHLVGLSPVDADLSRQFAGAVRRARGMDFFSAQMAGSAGMLRLLPYLPLVGKWGKVNLGQFADQFKDPFLRRAMRLIQYSMPVVPSVVSMAFLAGMQDGDLGFPQGGSAAFARAIATRFTDLGGQLHYRARVAKILTQSGRAVGIQLADGSEHHADTIVSAADGRSTIYDLLDGEFRDAKIDEYYTKRAPMGPQAFAVHVCFGVARQLPTDQHALVLLAAGGEADPAEIPEIAGTVRDHLDVEMYGFDPTLAPAGKSAIKVVLESDYDYWHEIRMRGIAEYRAEKDRTAQSVLDWLEKQFPGIREQVEVTDVATPLTTERYTASYRGLQAWGASEAVSPIAKGFTRTLPGLAGFHMAGQWSEATIGISTAATAGRRVVQQLCRQDGRKFKSS